MMGHLISRLRDERGSVLITAGIMALAFVLLGAVIVEAGQWFEHRRDIQTRADAAALAAGQALQQCFNVLNGATTEAQADAGIEGWAKSYGGIAGGSSTQAGAPFNQQFGTSSSNLMSFQSSTYPTAANPAPAQDLGPECDPSNLMLDVKMTQSGIPPLFSFSPLATVHGWARVQLQQIRSVIPDMPLVPPDVDPKAVAVTFVDEATGQALQNCTGGLGGCVFPLTEGSAPTSQGLSPWSGQATITVPANTNVGMRVSIGAQAGSCAGVNKTATYHCYVFSTTGQASPLGIVRIRGYSTAGAGAPTLPILRGVSAWSCSGSPFFSIVSPLDANGDCSSGVTAVVDFGAAGPPADAHIQATINGTTVPLGYDAGTNSWTSPGVALPVDGGPYPVTMAWCVGTCNNKNGFTAFAGGAVQQIFSGNDGSDPTDPAGPILAASVVNDANGNPGYTVPGGTPVTLDVALGLYGGVHLATPCSVGTPPDPNKSGGNYSCASDPPVLLRLVSNSSLSYAINCGTIAGNGGQQSDFYQQLRYGCANTFSINEADLCPDPTMPSPPYPSCAPTQQGGKVGQAVQALNDRFAPNGVCDANTYPLTNPNDPRVVTLLVTDFSAFDQSGSSTVPVTNIASFYVTGWSSADNSCAGINEPPPPGVRLNGTSASIWGHFIKYVTPKGKPSGYTCNVTEVTPCMAALVR
jgi:hypothetical protein